MWSSCQRKIVCGALFALVLAFLAVAAPGAMAEDAKPLKGLALVIGQTKYEHLPALPNPGNDARAIGKLLTDLGFEVTPVPDADAKKLKKALQRFTEDAADADVALIYYSGHGIEAGGENYLIPVDADGASLGDAGETLVPLSGILNELQQTAKITIMLLDACRSNPFPADAKIITQSVPQGIVIGGEGLAATKGMSQVEDDPADDSFGQVIGFAAEPGEPALDGKPGGNSPYAAALLKHLAANRGYEFGQVMTLVAEEVYLSTQAMQRPWTNGSLRRFLNFGLNPEEDTSDEALIRDTRRKLLVTIAATPADLRRTVETVAKEKSIPLAGMYDVLRALGQSDIPHEPERIDKLLSEQAENIAKMMAERRALDAGDPEIIRLAALADKAIDEGALPAARKFLDQAKAKVEAGRAAVEGQRERLKAKDAADAAIMARSAEAFERDFNYLAAAGDYAKAYSYVRMSDAALAFTYKSSEAGALLNHGDHKGDNDALSRSIESYLEAELLAPRGSVPLDWAMTQNNLGIALWRLGERESGTARLKKAVAAYRAALEEWTRERVPLDWARTQNNLGNALSTLGERESGTARMERLEEAIVAYRAALEEWTRERVPLDWAMAQSNLGITLSTLGELESWALTQKNLGNDALWEFLGHDTAKLEEAVTAYRAALEERTRERVPLDWARTQNNLGDALPSLGERESGTARLEEAVSAHRAALEEMTRERVPLQRATTQNNLGRALATLGEREGGTALLEEAVAVYREALVERTRERVPLNWANTQDDLGWALKILGRRTKTKALVQEGKKAVMAAWELYKSTGYDYDDYYTIRLAEFDRVLAELK